MRKALFFLGIPNDSEIECRACGISFRPAAAHLPPVSGDRFDGLDRRVHAN